MSGRKLNPKSKSAGVTEVGGRHGALPRVTDVTCIDRSRSSSLAYDDEDEADASEDSDDTGEMGEIGYWLNWCFVRKPKVGSGAEWLRWNGGGG